MTRSLSKQVAPKGEPNQAETNQVVVQPVAPPEQADAHIEAGQSHMHQDHL